MYFKLNFMQLMLVEQPWQSKVNWEYQLPCMQASHKLSNWQPCQQSSTYFILLPTRIHLARKYIYIRGLCVYINIHVVGCNTSTPTKNHPPQSESWFPTLYQTRTICAIPWLKGKCNAQAKKSNKTLPL